MLVEKDPDAPFWLVSFDPKLLTVLSDYQGGNQSKIHGPAEWLAQNPGLVMLAPGPMANCDPSEPHCSTHYATYTVGQPRYRMIDRRSGLDIPPLPNHADEGLTIGTYQNGGIWASKPPDYNPNAHVAVQGYPSLVVNQKATQGLRDHGPTWGVGLAWMPGEQLAIGIGYVSLPDLAVLFQRHGAIMATYMDGGGSGYWKAQPGAPDNLKRGSAGTRRLVEYIGILADPGVAIHAPPSAGSSAIVKTGSVPPWAWGLVAAGSAVALGTAGYLVWRGLRGR